MIRFWLILLGATLLLGACSTTKSLGEDDVLYRGSRIKFQKSPDTASWKIDEASEKYANVYWALWDTPNGALLGMPVMIFFPLRLFIYHDFYNEKTKGFSYWMRENFGEPPKTIAYINPDLKVQKGISIFEEYGHFGTTGSYILKYNKKGNKAYIRYKFEIKDSYKYRSVSFETKSGFEALNSGINDFGKTSILETGAEFNMYKIRSEKSRMVMLLQDSGFYFLTKKNMVIYADTTIGNKRLDLKMGVEKGLPDAFYQPQNLDTLQLQIDSVLQPQHPEKYYTWGNGKIKKSLFDSIIDIASGSRYSFSDTKRTSFLLSELGVFANPRIDFDAQTGDSLTIKPIISLEPLKATNIGFNISGNYKNTGYIGPSIGFTFKQLNIFHGAENLTVNGDVYYDFPLGKYRDRISNSYGLSVRSVLTKPLLRTPFRFINHKHSLPKQFYKLNYEYNVRQDYFDIITLNATYGWDWKSKSNISHSLGLIDVTLSDVRNTTPKFDTLTETNPILRETLIDQFLLGSYYEFHFQNKATTYSRWGVRYTGRIDLTGNALNLVTGLVSSKPKGEREIFGMKYAQFTRLTSEIVTNYHISKTHQLVFRNIAGVGFAYGNSTNMPFIKQYFIGGTNSLRPFTARTVGPGRYFQLNPAEVNQVGDFKLEFNVEFRFPLVWKLNAAIFTDMGNIWLLHPDPNRPGGEVRWGKLIEDSFLTAGVGIRLDIDYLVLRVDVGLGLYEPFFQEGNRWVFQNKTALWAPVFGIGYPF